MAEPRIFFYNPLPEGGGSMIQYLNAGIQFVAEGASGGAIKAGDASAVVDVAIWNNPYDRTQPPTNGTNIVTQPKNMATGVNVAWGAAADGVVAATDVDVTCRYMDGTLTGDVATGKWLKVLFVTPGGTDSAPYADYVPIGVNTDGSSAIARIGTIAPDAYFHCKFKLQTPGNATPGAKEFAIRVSYSFTG